MNRPSALLSFLLSQLRLLSLLSLLALTLNSEAVELMRWERIPLPVPLNAGQERIIFVDSNVRVGYPASLEGKLRIQNAGGTVYLLANQPFPTTRLQLQSIDNGELILLDVNAAEGKATLEPVKLVYGEEGADTTQQEGTAPSAQSDNKRDNKRPALPGNTGSSNTAPIPLALTRFAAQSLYAPLRVIEALPGVQQVATRLPVHITTLLPTESVDVNPIAAWRKAQYTVTAIRLQNRGKAQIELDPRALQGDFYAATFQHGWLGPAGSAEDTTVLYLVTRDIQTDRAILPEPDRAAIKATHSKTHPKIDKRGNR